MAPLKALKVNPGSTAHWVAEAQAALHRGAVSVRADPKEPPTQGGAVEAGLTQEGEAVPPPHDGEAHGSDAAEVPLAAEATGPKVPGVSQAGATEAAVPRTIEATTAGTGALVTTEATVAEADVSAVKPVAQEVEMKATEASVPPLVQGLPLL